jgi:hypothetical protein
MSDDYKLTNIVGTLLSASNTSNLVAFLTDTCKGPQKKTGAPRFLGDAGIRLAAIDAPIAGPRLSDF